MPEQQQEGQAEEMDVEGGVMGQQREVLGSQLQQQQNGTDGGVIGEQQRGENTERSEGGGPEGVENGGMNGGVNEGNGAGLEGALVGAIENGAIDGGEEGVPMEAAEGGAVQRKGGKKGRGSSAIGPSSSVKVARAANGSVAMGGGKVKRLPVGAEVQKEMAQKEGECVATEGHTAQNAGEDTAALFSARTPAHAHAQRTPAHPHSNSNLHNASMQFPTPAAPTPAIPSPGIACQFPTPHPSFSPNTRALPNSSGGNAPISSSVLAHMPTPGPQDLATGKCLSLFVYKLVYNMNESRVSQQVLSVNAHLYLHLCWLTCPRTTLKQQASVQSSHTSSQCVMISSLDSAQVLTCPPSQLWSSCRKGCL